MMRSLRVRLLACLCLALCTLWGGVAAWMFEDMRSELRNVLDNRLIASARVVAGVVHQFRPANMPAQQWGDMLNVIARDGVACEVSLVRSEIHPMPPALQGLQVLARTEDSPAFSETMPLGFSTQAKGGKLWRSYVLEDQGVRITTADRIDVREGLVHGFAYTLVLPFALALLASMLLMWWGVTQGLKPLEQLRRQLAHRPPGDDSPVAQGQQVRELAPLVKTLNHLLHRVRTAIERERRWSDDAAHELRTPLTAVKTHVQVAQMALAAGAGPAGTQAYAQAEHASSPALSMARQALESAGQGVDQLQHTLEQLLLLARLDCHNSKGEQAVLPGQGAGAADPLTVVCGGQAGHALSALDKAWQLAAHAVPDGLQRLVWLPGQGAHEDTALGPLHVALPEPLLVSALRNLLENALRHAPSPTPVQVGLRYVRAQPTRLLDDARAGKCGLLQFTVADAGPGLSVEDCDMAAQRFWRKQHQSYGSGLGLAIVQRIAQCGGGDLWLQPRALWAQAQARPGQDGPGLVVCLSVPVVLPDPAPTAQEPPGRGGLH